MADTIQIESDKKNWVKTLDDTLNDIDGQQTHWTNWSSDAVALINGFTNAVPGDQSQCLRTRQLVKNNGDVVLTDVAGVITNSGWNGADTAAFVLSSSVLVTMPEVIGLAGSVNASSDMQGVVSVGVGGEPGQWQFKLAGNRIDGQSGNLSGWIKFRFLIA